MVLEDPSEHRLGYHDSMSRAPWLLCAWLILALGCATLREPSEGGRPWMELRTEHVTLYTDLDGEEAMQAVRGFESRHHLLATALFAGDPPPLRSRVVAFRHERDYLELAPPNAGAFHTPMLPLDAQPTPTIVMHGSPTAATYAVWLHELTHRFIAASMGPVPTWLNEGLAEYYSTIRADGDVLYLGSYLGDVALVAGGGWRMDVDRGVRRLMIPITQIPPASHLMTLSASEFYLGHGKRVDGDLQRKRTANYKGSWALVHMLVSSPDYRPRYARAVELVAEGTNASDAICEAFADASAAELDAALVAYMQRSTFTVWPQPYEAPAELDPQVLGMPEPRVLVLWTKLGLGRAGFERTAAANLGRALASAPKDPFVLQGVGSFAHASGDLELARTRLEQARAFAPMAPDPLVALISLYEDGRAPWTAEEREQWLRDVVAELEIVASTATELDTLAKHHLGRGRAETARPLSIRAMQADPNCGECFEVHARIAFALGRPDEAMRMQRVAIDRMYEHASEARLVELERRLDEYETAAQASDGSQPDDEGAVTSCWTKR